MRVFPHSISKITTKGIQEKPDLLAVEEPLSVRLDFERGGHLHQAELMVTMRTPGHDEELVSGFLAVEGIIEEPADIQHFRRCAELPDETQPNRLLVRLREGLVPNLETQQRYGTINSACGVCGKTMLDDIQPRWNMRDWTDVALDIDMLTGLPNKLRAAQPIFGRTGGLHGVGLFDHAGKLILSREDIGRHNALDKVLGAALHMGLWPLKEYVIVLSGRIGFELVQKSLMAGCPILVAVGAPSSLAVQLAEGHHQTLLGFVKKGQANVYTHASRLMDTLSAE